MCSLDPGGSAAPRSGIALVYNPAFFSIASNSGIGIPLTLTASAMSPPVTASRLLHLEMSVAYVLVTEAASTAITHSERGSHLIRGRELRVSSAAMVVRCAPWTSLPWCRLARLAVAQRGTTTL